MMSEQQFSQSEVHVDIDDETTSIKSVSVAESEIDLNVGSDESSLETDTFDSSIDSDPDYVETSDSETDQPLSDPEQAPRNKKPRHQ